MNFIAVFFFFIAHAVLAEEVGKVSVDAKLRLSGQHVSQSLKDDSLYNPDNRILNLPKEINRLYVAPEAKLSADRFDLVYRPLIRTERQRATSKTTIDTKEFFGEGVLSERATFLLGVKNEQWGPTESLSPTNKIFRETILEKDPFYEAMGLYIARLNFALPWDLTVSLLAEISEVPGREQQKFRAGEDAFVAKGVARIEWNENADSLALVAGNTERGEAWVGEYASVRFFDQFTLYGEARHERSSRAWYPIRNGSLVLFEQKKEGSSSLDTLAVVGARYETEDQTDVRVEYIENTFGYSKDEKELLKKALDSQNPQQARLLAVNYERALLSGLDLRGKRYLYWSIRSRDALWMKELTLFARGMHSLADPSQYLLGGFDYALNDHATLAAYVSRTSGQSSEDLASPVSASQGVSLNYTF